MLKRQRTVLALLTEVKSPLTPTVFVKLVFLLRQETELSDEEAFYDFVPDRYGPFSFVLYHELANLRRDAYVTSDDECIALCEGSASLAEEEIRELPGAVLRAVCEVAGRYGRRSQAELLSEVCERYPWYATKSELSRSQTKCSVTARRARPAVCTAGYEGKSIDGFLDDLLQHGIEVLIDVRGNPVSRKYGFSRRQFSHIATSLGLSYRHMPDLGISARQRLHLTDHNSYQRLLEKYRQEMLPELEHEIREVSKLMKEKPAVLVCVEKDPRCCHRSRLAEAVSQKTGLRVRHL